jgi:hypothetical protein
MLAFNLVQVVCETPSYQFRLQLTKPIRTVTTRKLHGSRSSRVDAQAHINAGGAAALFYLTS